MKISWWQWWPFQPWRVVGVADAADEIPERPPRNAVAMVGSVAFPKWIAFDCPCRTGHRIMLNTDPARRPAWKCVVAPGGRLTIAPSVDYADGRRRCHYFVRDGKILWAKDTIR
jgi:hypothetical protein